MDKDEVDYGFMGIVKDIESKRSFDVSKERLIVFFGIGCRSPRWA